MPVRSVYRPRDPNHDCRLRSYGASSRTASVAARKTVCRFWLQGRRARLPCPFLHCHDRQLSGVEEQPPKNQRRSPPRSLVWKILNDATPPTPPTPPRRIPASSTLRRRLPPPATDEERRRRNQEIHRPDAEAHPGPVKDPRPPQDSKW